jgi:hypothetical protein
MTTSATVPWAWDDMEGANRVWSELDQSGFSLFNDPAVLSKAQDPVGFCESLFGFRPIRYQQVVVEPSSRGHQSSLPKTMLPGALHTDCAQLGMPAHVQVMVCERPAREGGGTTLLDMWPVLERISRENPSLYSRLFTDPRVLSSGHSPRVGTSVHLCRGNLICIHPNTAMDGPIGTALQRFIDEAEPVRFTCRSHDVYINNNHRCLHGREGFDDPARRFIRYLYWFDQPFRAPTALIETAAQGTAALAARLSNESFWL